MREAVVPADVDISWLDGCVSWVQASPVATEMGQMPLLIDEAVFLLLGHLIIDKFGSNTKVQNETMSAVSVFPVESLLELATGSKNAIHREMSRRRRWVEPAYIVFSKWIEEVVGVVYPLAHCFG